ncbi:glutamate receptor 2.8-like protein [Tanacetum coccineum]
MDQTSLKLHSFDLCCYLAKIIVVNLDSSSDNNNSDSYSTSQIRTSEEIDYDSSEPPKSFLKWYHYLSDEYKDNGRFWGSKSGCNESDVKPSWKDIEKAKACMLAKAQASEASSKAKVEACGSKVQVEACGSKAKLQASTKTLIVKSPVPITNCILGLANAKTWDAIKGKTFGVQIPLTMTFPEVKIGKRNLKNGKYFEIAQPSSETDYVTSDKLVTRLDFRCGRLKGAVLLTLTLVLTGWCDVGPIAKYVSTRDMFCSGLSLTSKVKDVLHNGVWNWPTDLLDKYPILNECSVPTILESLDCLEWHKGNGIFKAFSVHRVWSSIRPRDVKVPWFDMVWFTSGIPCHAFTLWLIVNRKLKTQDRVCAWDVLASLAYLLLSGVTQAALMSLKVQEGVKWFFPIGVIGFVIGR